MTKLRKGPMDGSENGPMNARQILQVVMFSIKKLVLFECPVGSAKTGERFDEWLDYTRTSSGPSIKVSGVCMIVGSKFVNKGQIPGNAFQG